MQHKPKWDTLTDERRKKCIQEVVSYFLDERGETIGVIAAENILDFVLELTFTDTYNKAVEDCKNIVKTNFDNLQVDLDLQESK